MARGFTLIEVLIGIGVLAFLAAIVVIAINPIQQFSDARDTQRRSDVRTILDSVQQNIIAHKGVWECWDKATSDPIEITPEPKNIGSRASDLDICHCLIPDYIAALPTDPSINHSYFIDCQGIGAEYNTGYTLQSMGSRYKVNAPYAESDEISITR